jgi:hypothetical protein
MYARAEAEGRGNPAFFASPMLKRAPGALVEKLHGALAEKLIVAHPQIYP